MSTKAPSKRTIQRRMRELRTLIDTTPDPVVRRIAYAMGGAVAWATSETVGWPTLADEAVLMAKLLRDDLAEAKPK